MVNALKGNNSEFERGSTEGYWTAPAQTRAKVVESAKLKELVAARSATGKLPTDVSAKVDPPSPQGSPYGATTLQIRYELLEARGVAKRVIDSTPQAEQDRRRRG